MESTIFENIDPDILSRIQSLRLIDDDLMTVVFSGDKKATEFLIRILLNRNDLTVTKSMTQIQKHNLFGDERAAETLKQGLQQGIQQKAIEDAVTIIKEFKISPESASNKMGAPLEKVLEALSSEKLEK